MVLNAMDILADVGAVDLTDMVVARRIVRPWSFCSGFCGKFWPLRFVGGVTAWPSPL